MSIMSDKVFFLRFKDHCATSNVFVALAVTGAIRSFTRTLSAAEGAEGRGSAERQPGPICLGSLPFKANK